MALTLRLDDADDRSLSLRASTEKRSKQEIAREAIHAYLTDLSIVALPADSTSSTATTNGVAADSTALDQSR